MLPGFKPAIDLKPHVSEPDDARLIAVGGVTYSLELAESLILDMQLAVAKQKKRLQHPYGWTRSEQGAESCS